MFPFISVGYYVCYGLGSDVQAAEGVQAATPRVGCGVYKSLKMYKSLHLGSGVLVHKSLHLGSVLTIKI